MKSSVRTNLSDTVRQAMTVPRRDSDDPLWKITPFIDSVGVFPNGQRYEFDWEREWRIAGDLHFELNDVALIFAEQEAFWGIGGSVALKLWGDPDGDWHPADFFLDPAWSMEELQDQLDAQPYNWGPPPIDWEPPDRR